MYLFRYEKHPSSVFNDICFWIRDSKHVKYFAKFDDVGYELSEYVNSQNVIAKLEVVTTKEDWIYFVNLLKRLYGIHVPMELRY